jgi:hypothetical protein
MQYVKMKIVAFDEASYSLLCSYASDETKSHDPNDYPPYAYQPMNMWPGVSDPEEIKKRLAVAGMWIAENQVREEQFVADPTKLEQYKAMVGQVVEYPVSLLLPPEENAEHTPFIEVL